jgi:hypothetical protein
MSAYTELNIKEGMPRATEAMEQLKSSLERCRRNKYNVYLLSMGMEAQDKVELFTIKRVSG